MKTKAAGRMIEAYHEDPVIETYMFFIQLRERRPSTPIVAFSGH